VGFDVIVIGSRFWGRNSPRAGWRKAGMKVLILERGRRWEQKPGPAWTAYPQHLTDPGYGPKSSELFNGLDRLSSFRHHERSRPAPESADGL